MNRSYLSVADSSSFSRSWFVKLLYGGGIILDCAQSKFHLVNLLLSANERLISLEMLLMHNFKSGKHNDAFGAVGVLNPYCTGLF